MQNLNQPLQDMLITTSRAQLPNASWPNLFEIIDLSRLGRSDIAGFVSNLFDDKPLTARLLDVIVTRTDGIPLFIEEIVDMLKQKSLIHNINGKTDFIDPDDIAQIPDSLRDSLQQKLDSLIYGKETAQLAAAIGREFDYDLLIASSIQTESEVQTDLEELVNSGIVYRRRKTTGDSYIFKHSLVRDTAYSSMSKSDRTNCHLEIARALKAQAIEQDSDKQVEIAKHFANAREFQKAIAQLTIRALDWKNTLFDDLEIDNPNSG